MKISVIIVNYNVEYFLEQCLNSVMFAMRNISAEVIVVDNHSIDASVSMLRKKFPSVKVIANRDNLGFSKANNQALNVASGEYCLLLNPDTLIEEDTLVKVCRFMDEHPESGGLGVKMVDGRGNFLPESKRGMPTPWRAFCKMFGLSALFPKSRRFAGYHLGYLNNDQTHEIEILSGAFMLLRASALKKTGLLDEAYFMYGEDIDLSYRLIQAGYKNFYFPETRIIHYKGESTKKSSVNYVFVFYHAMIIFARKHFSHNRARIYALLINSAIYVRAFIALLTRATRTAIVPAMDFILLFIGLHQISRVYQSVELILIPAELLMIALPVYTIVWMFIQLYCGGYDKPVQLSRNFLGALIGTGLILAVYALLSKEYQFSRLIILAGGIWVLLYYPLSRIALSLLIPTYRLRASGIKKFNIVGKKDEAERVAVLLRQVNSGVDSVQFVSVDEEFDRKEFIGTISQLDQILDIYHTDEVIFCARDVSSEMMITQMIRLGNRHVDFKIAQPEASFLIGSNSIDSQGDLYVLDINRISKPANRRNKRTSDCFLSLALLLLSPLMVWFYNRKSRYVLNLLHVFSGKRSFVGYAPEEEWHEYLPTIRTGILSPLDIIPDSRTDRTSVAKMNLIYAKNHSLRMDLQILFRNLKFLDR